MITAGEFLVVQLDSAETTRGFALGFECGVFSQLTDGQLDSHHVIWAANATTIELLALGRGFTMDVVDSHEDKLLIMLTRTPKAPCPK